MCESCTQRVIEATESLLYGAASYTGDDGTTAALLRSCLIAATPDTGSPANLLDELTHTLRLAPVAAVMAAAATLHQQQHLLSTLLDHTMTEIVRRHARGDALPEVHGLHVVEVTVPASAAPTAPGFGVAAPTGGH